MEVSLVTALSESAQNGYRVDWNTTWWWKCEKAIISPAAGLRAKSIFSPGRT